MSKKAITPFLSLVGAGPGDPELITLKAIRAIQNAEVILYDALANPVLLEYAPTRALRIFVGKRAGQHTYSQEEINQLIVQYALSHGHVLRLKGGDPFIFGRGHEELKYAQAFGIATAIIPGISSMHAVPALQNIPLTKRGVSESFWVITGTTSRGTLSRDIYWAAQSSATVVILMGMKKLPEIVKLFKYHGKQETGVAIIQNGSREDEKMGLGTIDSILDVVQEKELGAPAIIVIGEVVKEQSIFQYQWKSLEPKLALARA